MPGAIAPHLLGGAWGCPLCGSQHLLNLGGGGHVLSDLCEGLKLGFVVLHFWEVTSPNSEGLQVLA